MFSRSIIHFITPFLLLIASAASGAPALDIVNTDIARDTENLCTLRDRYGFLWIGTTTGLCCFDSNGTPVYRNSSGTLRSTADLSVNQLFECGDNIWFGGNIGIYVFDRMTNSASHFPYRTNYGVQISSRVDKMLDAGNGRIWICTQGQGLFIFNTADSTLLQDSRHGSFYSDMALGTNGLVYAVSLNGDVQSFRPDGRYMDSTHLPDFTTNKNSIFMAAQGGEIWIASGSSLYRLNTATDSVELKFRSSPAGTFNMMIARPDGTLLMATDTGLWSFDPSADSIDRLSTNDARGNHLSDPRISSMASDADGNILLITPTGGISEVIVNENATRFIALPSDPGTYTIGNALCLASDKTGVWIGSNMGVAFHNFSTGMLTPIALPIPSEDAVTAITTDGDKIWIGTRHSGLFLRDNLTGQTRHFTYDENIPYTIISNDINGVFRASDGKIYVLTDWGMCTYSPETDDFRQLTEIGQQTAIVTMQEDRFGRLWAATRTQGIVFQPNRGDRFVAIGSKTLGNTPVTMMINDSHGNLWIATQNDGVYIYNEDKKDFEHADIPFVNLNPVSVLQEDADGNVWIVSGNILVQVDPERNVHFHNFSRFSDMMPVKRSSMLLPDGEIAFGCRGGLMTFFPGKIVNDEARVRVFPRSLSLPRMEDDTEELNRLGLNTLLYTRQEIELPYDDNSFTIHLSASHPVDMPSVRCDYMLSGIDKNWIMGSVANEVTYNNLPPGKYEFLVRPSGVRDAETSRLIINILPPWYRTTAAYIVYLILLAGIGFGIFLFSRLMVRRHYRRRIEQMRIQNEREMFESKTRYFVDLVHEIRTPLMLISMPLEYIAERILGRTQQEDPEGNTPKYVRSMQRNLDYLLGITNQLLDFRKAENNSEIQLNLSRCDLRTMLSDICTRFEEPLHADGKEITLTLPQEEIIVTLDAAKAERLLMNMVGNAMKYSRKKVSVTLSESSEGKVAISVADDGPGVPEKERERIFDTYYQIGNDNVAAALGTGLGLAYAKLIAEAHHGDISVTDAEGGGALFTIILPEGKDLPLSATPQITDIDSDTADIEINTQAEEKTGEKQQITVLIVEDNRELRDMMTDSLSREYKVLTASDGLEALKILSAKDVKIIVSDVMMPNMDGMELCQRVKEDVNTSHIPFIILTAKTSADAHEEGMQCGADVYLEKPFPIRQLKRQIANILRTRQLFYKRIRSTNPLMPEKSRNSEQPPALNRYDSEFLEKMNRVIAENIADEDFSIDMLAESLNMSRSSFYRKITAVAGMPPGDYLKTYRLNYSVKLLCEGCRVTEVAANVGFTSSSYFAKCFRERFGVLPSEYVASQTSQGSPNTGSE